MHFMADWAHPVAYSLAARRDMASQWDDYIEVIPSGVVHGPPRNENHLIDEWWDESLDRALKWIFAKDRFDILLVNYVWLSKAFELAPAHIFRILDTHDKFSDRSRVLRALGIPLEYFYTTVEEEKRGLNRADIIWAIKEDEKIAFEKMTERQVVTLPHLDKIDPLPKPLPDSAGFLRVGLIGSRNNINVRNFTAFLLEMHAVTSHYMAPVKFYVGGGVCDWLVLPDYPEIELKGRVADIKDFYSSVDLIASPMIASTGLKIKTGEALAFGLPIVSTAHAFEGYAPCHPFHRLPSMRAVAEAISAISFEPVLLEELRACSVQSGEQSQETAKLGMSATIASFERNSRVSVIFVHGDALQPGSFPFLVLKSLWTYLSISSEPKIVVVAGKTSTFGGDDIPIRHFGRVFVMEDLVVPADRPSLAATGYDVISLEDSLAAWAPKCVFIDCLPPSLKFPDQSNIFYRMAVVALRFTFDEISAHVEVAVRAGASVTLVGNNAASDVASIARQAGANQLRSPTINGDWLFDYGHFRSGESTKSVLFVGEIDAIQKSILTRLLAIQGFGAIVIDHSSKYIVTYIESLLSGKSKWPALVVDGSRSSATQLLLEVFDRKHVDRLTISSVRGKSLHPLRDLGYVGNSFGELVGQILEHLRMRHVMEPPPLRDPDPDGGWAKIWSYINDRRPDFDDPLSF